MIGGAVFACLVAATLIGMALRARLPDHYLDAASKDVIRLATAIVGTLSALALGLLIASAKTDFDSADAELRSSVARVVLLDRILAQYGDETSEARSRLHELIATRLKSGWSDRGEAAVDPYDVSQTVEPIQVAIRDWHRLTTLVAYFSPAHWWSAAKSRKRTGWSWNPAPKDSRSRFL